MKYILFSSLGLYGFISVYCSFQQMSAKRPRERIVLDLTSGSEPGNYYSRHNTKQIYFVSVSIFVQ